MAKKLVNHYKVNRANNTISVENRIKPNRLLLITEVDTNNIVYNFAVSGSGITSHSFDNNTEYTVFHMQKNLTTMGIDSGSNLQIFIEKDYQEVTFDETYIDPVSKIRVSMPENLIDTDFEYGLQSTKWETVELSNNVPSYYISDADSGVSNIVQITSKAGSDVIVVQTVDAHRLVQGTPIDVRGLSSQTAEGKYIIQSVSSETTFTYKARATQGSTGRLDGTYTIITPGQFYAGSQIPYQAQSGITTDGENASTITITTPAEHGFVSQSNFYLVNTTSPKILEINQGAGLALDGEPTVDPTNTVQKVLSADMSNAETKEMKSTYAFKFKASAVDVAGSKILWRNSGFRVNDCVLYTPPQADSPIGGLQRFQQYYINSVDDSGFTLAATYNGTRITFTSTGTYEHGNASFHMVYEIYRVQKPYNDQNQYSWTRNTMTGVGSGWDLRNAAGIQYGLGRTLPTYMAWFSPIGYNPPTQALDVRLYSQGRNGTCTMPEGTHANIANFMEDFTMYRPYGRERYSTYGHTDGRTNASWSWSNRWSNYDYNGLVSRNLFLIFLNEDNEADTFYNENHGLIDGNTVTLETTGSAIFKSNHNAGWISFSQSSSIADGDFTVEVASKDRFRLIDPNTGDNFRIMNASGEYTLIADVEKETANSFYSQDHGLADGEGVVFTTLAGGTTPTSDTGRLDINSNKDNGNVEVAWTVFRNSLNSWIEGNLPGHRDILMDGPDARNPIRNGVPVGTASWLNNYFYDGVYVNTPLRGATNTANAADTYTWGDAVVDMAKDTNNSNSGFSARGAKYDGNQTLPFFGFCAMASRVLPWSDFRIYTRPYSDSGAEAWGTWNRRSHADNFYTSGWYTIETSAGREGHVGFELILHNENWQNDRTANHNGSWNNSTSGQGFTFTNNTEGKYVKFHAMFMLQNGTSFTTTTLYEMIDQLITYKTKVVNNNRFKLIDAESNIPVDLTSFGIPSFQFVIGRNGAADGAYTVSSVPSDNTFTIQLPFKIQKRAIEFNAAEVTASSDLIGVSNHKLISGLPMVYNPGGNVPIPGLISGSTYYTVVRDETLLGFASSSLDGTTGNLIDLTNSGSGIHTLEIDAMNGQFPGEGTVTILSGSTRVSGSDETLFKRYFKIGDIFRIKDTSESPARLSDFSIAAIADDNNMTLASVSPFNQNQTKYFIQTKIYARPDGTFLHRPFDGGVEITAGTAPFSQIVRQTRKYFRYQSGKGIQTSLAINFNPPVLLETLSSSGSVAFASTKYPHRLNIGDSIDMHGTDDAAYNGRVSIKGIQDEFNFSYDLSGSTPQSSIPGGLSQFNVSGWNNSVVRAGMFDFQNGFFYEYDGNDLYAVRRSSTAQISGTATVTYNSNLVQGANSNFTGQLNEGEYVVIRGQSYKIVKIKSSNQLVIQPQYKGMSAAGVIITKTEDVRVKQSDWNIDTADGEGPSGFELDPTKIQMAYMDYSWYGAGKVRFGFKDRLGKVIYVHHFLHNNRLTEAYMRSGNLPARYEIYNTGTPSYVPSLFHWGTSVIMDGRFDKDDSYLFTASSKPLSFTNGQTLSATTNTNSNLFRIYDNNTRIYNWYVRLYFPTADASKFSAGTKLFAPGTQLQGQEVTYAEFSGNSYLVNIFFGSTTNRNAVPAGSFTVPNATAVQIGTGAAGGGVNLGADTIPLITIRLAPSVDSGLPGALGQREIINRMQLILNEIGMIITHDCEVQLLLNADLSTASWENVTAPSLSELIRHESGDTALGGAQIFQYRASGGTVDNTGTRSSNTSNQNLGAIIDLGNSILGGDGAFPNGPDTLTVAVKVVDTSAISATSPFQISSRITWSESQA
jgi:hypothetical protein